METLEQKLKQFTQAKATGENFPKGYKAKINALMSGFNSGRFNAYLDPDFVESRKEANKMLEACNNLIRLDWEETKRMVVQNIIEWEGQLRKEKLLYGNCKANKILEAKITVSEFVCESLPPLTPPGAVKSLQV